MNRFVYNAATIVTKYLLLPIYTRISVTGVEHIPMTGPLIIASNHLNDVDPGILCTRIRRPIAFMAKVELFRIPGLAQFLRAFGAFPVKRGEADLSALRQANQALEQGLAVCIFPEGTREGPNEQLAEAWPGAAIIAQRASATILPVAINGSGGLALPKMFLFPYRKARITLTIGEPFVLPKPERLNAEAAQDGTRQIMERIAALLPEANRGYYGYVDSITPSPRRGEGDGG
jgi:1-acyl-sn-glycerol-3-phosphate acyltransferase